MTIITDPKQAGERLLQFAREGRLVQYTWSAQEDGREIACLLGAAAGIDDANECPASLMPAWVALALPGLFDGQSKAHAIAIAIRWGEAMIRDEWRSIDWNAVRAKWLAFVVQQAKDAAAYYAAAAYAASAVADAAAASAVAYAAAASTAAYAAAASTAAYPAASAASYAASAASYADAAAHAAARDAQADALMDAIERAMEVSRG